MAGFDLSSLLGKGSPSDVGFGLNYNQGFKSGPTKTLMPNMAGPEAMMENGLDTQKQMQLANQNFGFQSALQGQALNAQNQQLIASQAGENYRTGLQAQTQKDITGLQTQAQRDVTGMQQSGETSRLQSQLANTKDIATLQQAGDTSRLGMSLDSQKAIAAGEQGNLNYRQGQDLANQRALNTQTQGAETQRAGIAAQAQELPALLRQQNFNRLLPIFQGQLGQLTGGADGPGLNSPRSPEITVGGVLNDQQVQQQVNAARASNDATAARQEQTNANQLAGRGFAPNSPLLSLLNQGAQMGALANSTDQERQLRTNAAQLNAGQVLQSQQAREQQFASRQQEQVARRGQDVNQRSAILAALAGLQ